MQVLDISLGGNCMHNRSFFRVTGLDVEKHLPVNLLIYSKGTLSVCGSLFYVGMLKQCWNPGKLYTLIMTSYCMFPDVCNQCREYIYLKDSSCRDCEILLAQHTTLGDDELAGDLMLG